jgi:hypothetical protein
MQGIHRHELATTMNPTNLRILQLNIIRSRAGMEALINDPETQDLDILLIQEPPVTAYRTHVNHRLWHLYQPTHTDEGTRKRSLIYVHKRISTSAHRQIRYATKLSHHRRVRHQCLLDPCRICPHCKVYNAFPGLAHRDLSTGRNGGDTDYLAQADRPVAPEPTKLSLWGYLKIYASQDAFLPSVSLSILYLTVLSFAGQMVTYLLASGYTAAMIAAIRLVSTSCEMSATWVAPPVMAWVGPIRSGLWFLTFQMACLTVGLTIFWTAQSPMWAASGLVGGTILNRIGLWGFDFSAQVIIQDGGRATISRGFLNHRVFPSKCL